MLTDLAIAEAAVFFEVDITSSGSIAEAAKEIREKHGDPTVLVGRTFLAPR